MKEEDLQEWVKALWGDAPVPSELLPEITRLTSRKFVEWELVETVHQWLYLQLVCSEPGRIVAPSRTGKTRICELFMLKHKSQRQAGRRDIVPVLHIQAPEDCPPGEFFVLILESLKFPVGSTSQKIADLRRQVLMVLEESKVRMLIIDEANFLKAKTYSEVRRIYDHFEKKSGLSIILVGTDRLDAVVKRDEQVHGRFSACYRFGVLSGEKFKLLVEAWEEEIVKLPLPSNLTSPKMLKLLQEKTQGKVGHLDKILRKAAILALKNGTKKIDQAVLKEVLEHFS